MVTGHAIAIRVSSDAKILTQTMQAYHPHVISALAMIGFQRSLRLFVLAERARARQVLAVMAII